MDQLNKAVDLSQNRYCGVSYVYKKAMEVTWEIRITPDTEQDSVV
jgi:putative redox protein